MDLHPDDKAILFDISLTDLAKLRDQTRKRGVRVIENRKHFALVECATPAAAAWLKKSAASARPVIAA